MLKFDYFLEIVEFYYKAQFKLLILLCIQSLFSLVTLDNLELNFYILFETLHLVLL